MGNSCYSAKQSKAKKYQEKPNGHQSSQINTSPQQIDALKISKNNSTAQQVTSTSIKNNAATEKKNQALNILKISTKASINPDKSINSAYSIDKIKHSQNNNHQLQLKQEIQNLDIKTLGQQLQKHYFIEEDYKNKENKMPNQSVNPYYLIKNKPHFALEQLEISQVESDIQETAQQQEEIKSQAKHQAQQRIRSQSQKI